ncbi:pyroglutamyl-peptidase I [Ramlibacter sp. MAHUQ-53]|uniref:pyroglutamyl-peptidase I n=1 Tax=unclassified Ramlibacter TaxID=2617605 RepID=UPI00362C4833
MPRILLTGFEPFDGQALNPSAQAVRALDGERVAGLQVVSAVLPTAFGASLARLDALLEAHRPALVLACGQAGGRAALCLERVALNLDDARIPDNAGARPIDRPVVPGAPAAYFATLPVKAMREALRAAGLPAEVSLSAGTFVCNHVFYGLMHRLAQPRLAATRGGFMHLPWLPQQGEPSLALERSVQGLRLALDCAARVRQDLDIDAGTLHGAPADAN